MDDQFDVFISHASEDKDDFVIPLVHALEDRGLRVWFDGHQIKLGDDFRQKMDDGLARSDFGVLVLSPSYSKYWTEAELSALFNQARVFEELKILPVLHLLTHVDATRKWPRAADKALSSADGVDRVADKILRTIAAASPSTATSSTTGRSRLLGLPALPSAQFVGREAELARLEEVLGPSSVALAASLEGLAGVGKTQIALQLVHRQAQTSAFPGGIFWLPAENPDLTAVWGTTIADGLGIAPGPIDERSRQVVLNLSRRSVPVLVVLDSVEHWASMRRPRPLPEGQHVRFLITTRRRRLGGPQFEHIEVGFLTDAESRQLLMSHAGKSITEEPGFGELLEHLGGHALAVELAGAFLSEYPGETPATYLAAIREGEEGDEDFLERVGYGQTIGRVLETAWQRLDEITQDAWLLAARFAPFIVLPELSEAVGMTPKLLGALHRLHLVDVEPGGRWRMSRLVVEFGRSPDGVDAARLERASLAFADACRALLSTLQFQGDPRSLIPHMAHFEEAVRRTSDPETLSYLSDRLGALWQTAGNLPAARALFEKALALALEVHGESHPTVAMSRSNLGLVLKDQGDLPGARALLEQALALALEVHGESHPAVATSRSNLGLVLKDQGDLPGARALLEQALAVALEVHGESHPTVATSRSNLGLVLKDQEDFAGARDLLEQALAVDLEVHGESHPTVAARRSNLGLVLHDQGDLAGARNLLEQALASGLYSFSRDLVENPISAATEGRHRIERSIEFPPEFMSAGTTILSQFSKHLEQRCREVEATTVRIALKGHLVSLEIETVEGELERVEESLRDYGLVIAGHMAPEEFYEEPALVLDLKADLRAAQLQLEHSREISILKDRSIVMLEAQNEKLHLQNQNLSELLGATLAPHQMLPKLLEQLVERMGDGAPNPAAEINTVSKMFGGEPSWDDQKLVRAELKAIQARAPGAYARFTEAVVASTAAGWFIELVKGVRLM